MKLIKNEPMTYEYDSVEERNIHVNKMLQERWVCTNISGTLPHLIAQFKEDENTNK